MFGYCEALTNLELSNFDTSNVTNMSRMFYRCGALTNLELSNFDTSKVTNMSYMFGYCSALTIIKGSLDLSSAALVTNMFIGCTKLKNVHLKNVPRTLNLSNIGGIEGETYIIDNYID